MIAILKFFVCKKVNMWNGTYTKWCCALDTLLCEIVCGGNLRTGGGLGTEWLYSVTYIPFSVSPPFTTSESKYWKWAIGDMGERETSAVLSQPLVTFPTPHVHQPCCSPWDQPDWQWMRWMQTLFKEDVKVPGDFVETQPEYGLVNFQCCSNQVVQGLGASTQYLNSEMRIWISVLFYWNVSPPFNFIIVQSRK